MWTMAPAAGPGVAPPPQRASRWGRGCPHLVFPTWQAGPVPSDFSIVGHRLHHTWPALRLSTTDAHRTAQRNLCGPRVSQTPGQKEIFPVGRGICSASSSGALQPPAIFPSTPSPPAASPTNSSRTCMVLKSSQPWLASGPTGNTAPARASAVQSFPPAHSATVLCWTVLPYSRLRRLSTTDLARSRTPERAQHGPRQE
ncbi:hypothetical protein ACCO45_008799 [Purpureocillium lilacinum]|uniref:Uncharacterized protein n=1 Tax=Purpureocillium lilacinum TaxID=33203 RepID=A0ACC4DIY6_PURLI